MKATESDLCVSVVKSLIDGLIVVDKNGKIKFLNSSVEKLTGWKEKDALKKPLEEIFKIIDERKRTPIQDPLGKVLKNGVPVDLRPHTLLIDKKDNEIPIDFSIVPLKTKSGSIRGAALIFRNISKHDDFIKITDEFVSIVSHELRTPLTSIREALAAIQDGLLGETTEKQKEFLSLVVQDIDRITHIVNDLLDLSKIEARKFELKRELVDINELIHRVLAGFKNLADKKEIALKKVIPANCPDLFIDPEKVTQVIINLISNAYKFTNKEGEITVEVKSLKNEFQISVSDTGCGIPKENLEDLFKKFSQVNHHGMAEMKGTGLGLSIAKELVELHNGRIYVKSKVGQGTQFIFSLPKLSSEEVVMECVDQKIHHLLTNKSKLSLLVGKIECSQESLRNDFKEYICKNLLRSSDVAIDLGEFLAIILLNTSKIGSTAFVERLGEFRQSYIAKNHVTESLKLKTGVATFPEDGKNSNILFQKAKALTEMAPAREGMSILIVDDDVDFLEMQRELLEIHGFSEIFLAPGGEEGIQLAFSEKPDVILLDMNMPKISGYEVIGRLKTVERTADIPIIIMTGYSVDGERLNMLTNSKFPIFTKPAANEEVIDQIEKMITMKQGLFIF